jgi:hypothetical protein
LSLASAGRGTAAALASFSMTAATVWRQSERRVYWRKDSKFSAGRFFAPNGALGIEQLWVERHV